jgi:hypothetical protein
LLAREPVTFTTRVSCNTFTLLVCAPVTSTNQFNQDSLLLPPHSSNNQLEEQCLILQWQVFFHVQVGCCIRHK